MDAEDILGIALRRVQIGHRYNMDILRMLHKQLFSPPWRTLVQDTQRIILEHYLGIDVCRLTMFEFLKELPKLYAFFGRELHNLLNFDAIYVRKLVARARSCCQTICPSSSDMTSAYVIALQCAGSAYESIQDDARCHEGFFVSSEKHLGHKIVVAHPLHREWYRKDFLRALVQQSTCKEIEYLLLPSTTLCIHRCSRYKANAFGMDTGTLSLRINGSLRAIWSIKATAESDHKVFA